MFFLVNFLSRELFKNLNFPEYHTLIWAHVSSHLHVLCWVVSHTPWRGEIELSLFILKKMTKTAPNKTTMKTNKQSNNCNSAPQKTTSPQKKRQNKQTKKQPQTYILKGRKISKFYVGMKNTLQKEVFWTLFSLWPAHFIGLHWKIFPSARFFKTCMTAEHSGWKTSCQVTNMNITIFQCFLVFFFGVGYVVVTC